MFKKTFRLIISTFISFNLVVLPAFAGDIQVEERTIEKIDTFLKAGNPSDIPFIDYVESFTYDNIQPLKNFDLSSYIGKKIFLGYGVYDNQQNFCKYVEKPGMDDPKLHFQSFTTFNKHSYALSFNPMNYSTCVNLASKFNGIPASITSAAENGYLSSMFPGKNKWIGMQRANCSSEYINKDGANQKYFNWSTSSEMAGDCNESTLYAKQNQYGTWNKINPNELNYCVVEIDSEEITRPIKICAPWWRIEREYKKDTETTFYGVDVYKINQADIPESFSVCTKYEKKAIQNTLEQPYRDVTCTSYYDSVIAEECLRNPMQSICYVDECNGYIKNACRLKATVEPYKDYTKTEVVKAGANIVAKGKVGIKTHIYSCPPSLPSLNSCQEQSNVIIFPKECPGSDCEGYSKCVHDSSSIEEKNLCSGKYVCEKIYGNPDNVEFNTDGTLKYLKNTCSDGTVLNFEPSIQHKNSKKCLEYEYYTIEEEVSQRCVLDRPYSDYVVDTSLTEIDIYMNNPSCIRLNNVTEARPSVKININSTNFGYALTSLKKAYLDGTEGEKVNIGEDNFLFGAATSPADPMAGAPANKNEANQMLQNGGGSLPTEDSFNCSEFYDVSFTPVVSPGSTNFPEIDDGETSNDDMSGISQKPFFTDIQKFLEPASVTVGGVTNTFTPINITKEGSSSVIRFENVLNDAQCSALKTNKGGTSHNYQSVSKICKVYVNSPALSAYDFIQGKGSYDGVEYENYILRTGSAINEKQCKQKAYCLDGTYNKNAYNNSATSPCEVNFGDSYEYEAVDDYEWVDSVTNQDAVDENCMPYSSNHAYQSQLDGTSDIFAIQEVSNGGFEEFGYFSNYNSHPYKSNVISINGKEVYPLKQIPVLSDPLVYDAKFTQISITTKKPNIAAGALGGAAAGAATYAAFAVSAGSATLAGAAPLLGMGPIGWIIFIVIVVFVVVAMIFGKKQKFNEQYLDWIIYKLIPNERYVKSEAEKWKNEGDKPKNYKNYSNKYDHRKEPKVIGNNTKVVYARMNGFTGTLKPDKFRKMLNDLYTSKMFLLTCMGWFKSDVANITHAVEKDILVSYPTCKTFSWSCNKKKKKNFSQKVDPFFKRMNNSYIAAVNGVSIVVPYLGDYELKAYNKEGNLLSTMTIRENDFLETTSNVARYAQVYFGLGMGLADGIREGTDKNACRYDLMTEWGGGVSGIYFENNQTGNSTDCQKSHDGYVRENSATKITIKALTSDREHIIDLDKRLPFPNRVFLVTLNEKEVREYRCFEDFGDCESENFSNK